MKTMNKILHFAMLPLIYAAALIDEYHARNLCFYDSPPADLKGLAEARGTQFTYLKELPKGPSVYTALEGFGNTPKDYDIRVENAAAHAGVRQTSDRPLAKLVFWSIRTTVCPEAYIDMRIEPGKEFTWRIVYDFYTLPESGAK